MKPISPQNWQNTQALNPKVFTCGYCGYLVSSNRGYNAGYGNIYVCPDCSLPNFFGYTEDRRKQWRLPNAKPGSPVLGVPPELEEPYDEARACIAIGAFTASVMLSRKLLMQIAVDLGADPNKRFVEYVDYLSTSGYVPPNGKAWLDHIRQRGNEANHEIPAMTEKDATDLIAIIELMLKTLYEMPSRIGPSE